MVPLHRIVPLVAIVASLPAYAGSKEEAQAEAVRLAEEMGRLARRTAWRGVDDAYVELLELQKKGVVVTYESHYLAAEAARELGNINDVYARLKAAQAVQSSTDVQGWLADIESNYGRVTLKVEGKYNEDIALGISEIPFAPDQRRAVEKAQAVVAADRAYEGLLPFGTYTYGPKTFELSQDDPEQIVAVLPGLASNDGDRTGKAPRQPREPRESTGLAWIGPRVDLGGAFTGAGAPSAPAGVSAAAFGGMGARVGLGLEIGFTKNIGVAAEVGYHNLFGATDTTSTTLISPDAYVAGDRMNMGFGWLAGVYRTGDVGVAAGPIFGAGTAETLGCAAEGNGCAGGSSDVNPADVAATGTIRAGGVAGGVSYNLFDLGPFRGGVGLFGGAQSDSERWYTWGQLALTVAPGMRRKG